MIKLLDNKGKSCLSCKLYPSCTDKLKSSVYSCSLYKKDKGLFKFDLNSPSLHLDSTEYESAPESTQNFDSKASDFDIAKIIDDVIKTEKIVSPDLKIPDGDFKLANNFYEFCTKDEYLDSKPFLEQALMGLIVLAEYCPRCSDMEWMFETHKVTDGLDILERKVSMLEHGVCPQCKKNRASLIKKFGLKFYYEAAIAAGQRCITGESLVFTQDGLMKIEEYENSKPLGFSPLNIGVYNGKELEITSDFFVSKPEQVKKVVLKNGYYISGTIDHPIYTLNGFKKLSNVTEKDYVKIEIGGNIFGNKIVYLDDIMEKSEILYKKQCAELPKPKGTLVHCQLKTIGKKRNNMPVALNEELCIVMGFLVAEGRGTGITSTDKNVLDCINRVYSSIVTNRCIKVSSCHISLRGLRAKCFIQSLMCQPLQDGSTYLEVPLFIRQGPKKYQIDFLRGLFEGDGDLEQNHISYTTISKNLAYQISALLLNLGIYNSIDFKGILATNSSANQVSKKAYTIRIVGKFMKIFKEEIGFFSERKQLALDESLQRYDTKEVDMSFSYNKLPVPIKKEFLKFIKQLETSISQFPVCKHNDASSVKQNQPCELETLIGSTNTDIGLNDIYSIMHTDNVSLTTKKLKLLCGRLRLSEHYFSDKQKAHLQYFEGIADSIYVKVKRMRTSTQLVKTYDFALPDTHQFWSNGIISHNSGKSAWVADMSCYHTHRVLKLQNPNKVYDLKESNMLHATFVALTFNQAKDNLWDPFSGNISGSPWFQEYHKMLSEYQYKGKGKEELFRYKDTFLLYKHRRFICYPSGPDKRILRGRTRMLASIDELGWMDNEANSKKIKANAHEVYIALQNSLLTVRGACENLMKMGFYDIPHGLFLNISSPSSTRDKIMELVKQSLTSDRIYGKIKPTWEMNPRFPFNCKVIQEEFKKNPIAAMRDYGAQPPLNSSPLIESKNAIQKCIGKKPNSIKVQYAQSKSKDGTIRRYSIADTVKKTKHISVLALDAGYSKNAFACAVGHKVSDKLISIDLLTEVQPLPGMKLNFNKILKHLLSLIIDNRNCILVCADRWQSIKLLDDIEDEFGASTKQYSLKYNEFSLFKDWLYDGQIIFPQPETDIDRIISYEHSNYPMCFKYRPVDHFILQCLTVQDTGSSVVKGDNLTDDLFRAANLMFSQLLDPKNQDLFTLQEEAIEQTVNNLVIGVMRGLSSGSGRAVSEVNPQQAQLGLYKTRQG